MVDADERLRRLFERPRRSQDDGCSKHREPDDHGSVEPEQGSKDFAEQLPDGSPGRRTPHRLRLDQQMSEGGADHHKDERRCHGRQAEHRGAAAEQAICEQASLERQEPRDEPECEHQCPSEPVADRPYQIGAAVSRVVRDQREGQQDGCGQGQDRKDVL
ncbi:MAG: hypothetical protein IFJ96_08115, partial [Acidobacteria bacterium]|nr:hypothetical protein [Candidatus Sulfomarinibacter sp. MAG AM2]